MFIFLSLVSGLLEKPKLSLCQNLFSLPWASPHELKVSLNGFHLAFPSFRFEAPVVSCAQFCSNPSTHSNRFCFFYCLRKPVASNPFSSSVKLNILSFIPFFFFTFNKLGLGFHFLNYLLRLFSYLLSGFLLLCALTAWQRNPSGCRRRSADSLGPVPHATRRG